MDVNLQNVPVLALQAEICRRYAPTFPPPMLGGVTLPNALSPQEPPSSGTKYRVAIIGSGNWGSVVAKIAAYNTVRNSIFEDEVRMWVFEELIEGQKLSEVINTKGENVKYLPGVQLGANVKAVPDLLEAVNLATLLVFVTPHQFVKGLCKQMIGNIPKHARAISLIKGMDITVSGPCMVSETIEEVLGVECSVLMGANVANDVAKEEFCEATVGCADANFAQTFVKLFDTSYFQVASTPNVKGVELCGTVKNVVALGAGFVDGLKLGSNTKAAIMRVGLEEMRKLSRKLFGDISDDVYFQSCGVADLITTCYGGRNRKVSEAYVGKYKESPSEGGASLWEKLEKELLGGQKLQGFLTSVDLQELLVARHWEHDFPFFTTINLIATGKLDPINITSYRGCSRS
ncbi:hypothetical protein CYMTET_8649 [Cymbomonas tetramitiformis]|uniref:Glycerol-3-phosphate dehydrogenase [NAD(+)] n=1 Tax=Cymbomonas tetramitiformis TaxID=36881 RepID=A0AAE0LG99_9CHLO|nr:hypothetical protein CYMTET_8649 [Cymbomonas tetramitiformis]